MSAPETAPYFGPTEIAAPYIIERNACDLAQHRDFDQDLAIALALPAAGSLWGTNWPDKLTGIIVPAYPLYLHASANSKCCDQLLELQHGRPVRRLHRKPELLAIKAVARPQDEAQDKCCSAYAIMLKWAALKGLTPDEFQKQAGTVTLSQCRKELAAAKATSRASDPTNELKAQTPVRREVLTLIVSSENGGVRRELQLGIKTAQAMQRILESPEISLPVVLAQLLGVVDACLQDEPFSKLASPRARANPLPEPKLKIQGGPTNETH